MESYATAVACSKQLRNLIASNITLSSSSVAEHNQLTILSIIKQLTEMCIAQKDSVKKFENQKILCSLRIHELIIKILNFPFTNKILSEEGRIREIFIASYVFLKEFCESNSQNQQEMQPYVNKFMLKHLGVSI